MRPGRAGRAAHGLELLLAVVFLALALMVATVPLTFALVVGTGFVVLLSRASEPHAAALVASSLLAMLGLVELCLRALPEDAGPQYYRPHEILAGHELEGDIVNYRPNQRIEGFAMPFGDLGNLSPVASIRQPRVVDFDTDDLGFRNRQPYQGQALVLLGDSFVVGNSTTQDAILSEVLTDTHGIPVYSAAYVGELEDYVARLRLLERRHGAGFKGIFVLFEGNDFRCARADRRPERRRSGIFRYLPGFVRELESYRALYGLTRRAYHAHLARDQVREDLSVLVKRYGDGDVAFLKKYASASRQPGACTWDEHRRLLQSISDRIALLVFVPTKYRVYASLPDGREELPPSSSAAFLRQLAHDLSVPYLDLTPALVAASQELLPQGRYTYWRDDTHWNENGIRVAAHEIATLLRAEHLVAE